MKQIRYGDSSFTLRLEMDDWDVENISAVNIEVKSRGGTDLLASTAATLYTATTLGAAATAGDMSVTLAEGSAAPSPRDRMVIAANNDGERERVVVHHYDAANLELYTKMELNESHESGADVYGCFATYALDASDTDTFTKGKIAQVIWTPVGSDDLPVSFEYKVSGSAVAGGGLWDELENTYRSTYEMVINRDLDKLEDAIKTRFGAKLRTRGLDTDRVKDQTLLLPGLVLFARYIIHADDTDPEIYNRTKVDFAEWLDDLASAPIWQDFDQDDAEDEVGEVQPHYPDSLYRVI